MIEGTTRFYSPLEKQIEKVVLIVWVYSKSEKLKQ